MDKILKISLSIAALIIAFSIAYYFAYFLPKNESVRVAESKMKIISEKENDCRTLVKPLIDEDSKFRLGFGVTKQLYGYSVKTGQCLYFRIVSFSGGNENARLVNVDNGNFLCAANTDNDKEGFDNCVKQAKELISN